MSLIGSSEKSRNEGCSEGYKRSIKEFSERIKGTKLTYVPGVIRHFFHGSKKNRKYNDRWQILVKHGYDPFKHVFKNESGLLVPTNECPQGLLDDILIYFSERNEDECFENIMEVPSIDKELNY